MKLTAAAIAAAAAPREKPLALRDGAGLVLLCRPNGSASWQYVYDFGGRRRRFTIGPYPLVTLTDARRRHAALRRAVLVDRTDPARDRQLLRQRITVDVLWAQYETAAQYLIKSWRQQANLYRRHAKRTLGTLAAADVTTADLAAIVDAAARRSGNATAAKVQSTLRAAWRFGVETGAIKDNPARALRNRCPIGVRTMTLSDEDIRHAWHALPPGNARILLRLLLATGARTSEIAGAGWSELTGDNCWLIVPGGRTKNGRTRRVYLPEPARAALEELAATHVVTSEIQSVGRPAWKPLFPRRCSPRDAAHPVFLWRALRPLELDWRPHDLRRTVRTRLAALGVPENVAERAIGHAPPRLVRTYDQHDYETEIADAMNCWGLELNRILNQTNVIDFPSEQTK